MSCQPRNDAMYECLYRLAMARQQSYPQTNNKAEAKTSLRLLVLTEVYCGVGVQPGIQERVK
jgi:hypothetical protein